MITLQHLKTVLSDLAAALFVELAWIEEGDILQSIAVGSGQVRQLRNSAAPWAGQASH